MRCCVYCVSAVWCFCVFVLLLIVLFASSGRRRRHADPTQRCLHETPSRCFVLRKSSSSCVSWCCGVCVYVVCVRLSGLGCIAIASLCASKLTRRPSQTCLAFHVLSVCVCFCLFVYVHADPQRSVPSPTFSTGYRTTSMHVCLTVAATVGDQNSTACLSHLLRQPWLTMHRRHTATTPMTDQDSSPDACMSHRERNYKLSISHSNTLSITQLRPHTMHSTWNYISFLC